jgi:hypothetical protein
MRKALLYGAVLIGVYIATAYATGFGTDVTNTANGVATVAKTLQGR